MLLPSRLQNGSPAARPVRPAPRPGPVEVAPGTAGRCPLACAAGPNAPSADATSGIAAAVNHHLCLIAVALLSGVFRRRQAAVARPPAMSGFARGDAIAFVANLEI